MSLALTNIRLPLAGFDLKVTATLGDGITGLSGPSGSGKTSLLETIAGLRRPVAGRITLGSTILSDSGNGQFLPAWQRKIGYVPQDQALFPHWNAVQNLQAHQRFTATAPDPALLATITALLELEPLLARKTATLSGGEKGRLALGRALLSRPVLLLLDEPLAHLDDRLRDRALAYFKSAAAEFRLPILMASHSAYELQAICGTVLRLDRGEIIEG